MVLIDDLMTLKAAGGQKKQDFIFLIFCFLLSADVT